MDKNLIKFEDILNNIEHVREYYIGIKPIPIEKIVGTVGRYPKFYELLMQDNLENSKRYQDIKRLYEEKGFFPPIKVYQILDKYFIIDGHHRVLFLKKEKKAKYIDAEIIKIDFDINLDDPNKEYQIDDQSAKKFLIELERKSFERKTGLYNDILTFPIILTELGGYQRLFNEMKDYHKKRMEEIYQKGEPLKYPDVESHFIYSNIMWYRKVFLPVIEMIKKEKILEYFPNRTESDLYVWINQHKYYLSEKAGYSVDIEYSTEDFVKKFGEKSPLKPLKNIIQKFSKLLKK